MIIDYWLLIIMCEARSPAGLTFEHWAGISSYTSSYDLAGTCVFGKQSPGLISCGPILTSASPYP